MPPFNPVERAKEIEDIVISKGKRKYYRFRYSRYYGGIVTADTVGCNLLCAYCWNYFKNLYPKRHGNFYSAKEVVAKLLAISRKKNVNLFRISGAEPILGEKSMKHLVEVIEHVNSEYNSEFILETNGLMIGYIPELADGLEGLNVAVRITIKGWDEESFEKITGADGSYFKYQINALRELRRRGLTVWPAVMYDIFGQRGLEELRERLKGIGMGKLELESLEKYPFVIENLRRGIKIEI